jgi:hypothetical protein
LEPQISQIAQIKFKKLCSESASSVKSAVNFFFVPLWLN